MIYQNSIDMVQNLEKKNLICKYQGKMENLDAYCTYTRKKHERKTKKIQFKKTILFYIYKKKNMRNFLK